MSMTIVMKNNGMKTSNMHTKLNIWSFVNFAKNNQLEKNTK